VLSAMSEIGTRCTVIGEVTATTGISVLDQGGAEYSPGERGFNHFRQ
jgi:thiamine monophosphate kinase